MFQVNILIVKDINKEYFHQYFTTNKANLCQLLLMKNSAWERKRFRMLVIPLLLSTIAFNLGCCASTPSKRCLEKVPESSYKHIFYVDQNTTSINIEVSLRPSHQILSRIVRIIIREVLSYENVSFTNTSENINKYTFCSMPGFIAPINSMINVESWVPVLFNLQDLDDHSNVVSVGPLGALGSFGWYVPTYLMDEMWQNHSVNLRCGQSLRQSDISMFASEKVYQELKNLIDSDRSKNTFPSHCGNNSTCREVYHSSEKCASQPGSCPILVSSHFRIYGECLIHFIKSSNLEMTVFWIGDGVYDYVLNKTKEKIPVMYFGWNLDVLSVNDSFSPVHLSPLYQLTTNGVVSNCDWQVRPIHKMVWNKLRVYAPEVHQMLTNMGLSNSQIMDMVRRYQHLHSNEPGKEEDKILEEVACQWVRKNDNLWKKWLPPKGNKTPIYIGGLFSCTGKAMRDFSTVIAAELAAEYINNDPNILPNHSIQVLVADTASVPRRKVNSITAYMTNKTHRVLGLLDTSVPSNFEDLVGSMSTVYSIPLIAHNSKSFALSQRKLYPYFFRINSIFMDKAFALLEMFEMFNWKRVGLFIEDSSNLEGYHNFFKEFLGSRNINVAFDSKVPSIVDLKTLSDSLDQLKKKRVNIVVVALEARNMLAFLCQIYDKKMASSNNYSWFFMTLTTLVDKWWNVNNSQYYHLRTTDCTQSKITEALQSHFVFNNAQLDSANNIIIGNNSSTEIMDTITRRLKKMGKGGLYPVSSEAFDAILVYGRAFHQMLHENSSALAYFHEENTLRRFVQIVESLHFDGLTGPIKFKGADRSGIVEILQMQLDDFVKVGHFKPEQNNISADGLVMDTSTLIWRTSSGKAPGDSLDSEKACSVETIRALLGVECDMAIIFINVFVFGVTLVPIILFLIYIKKRYDDKIKLISKETPQIVGWELTRNEIILNRKIGQGEFGTVFGGEAKINQNWVAVAVKTLKPESTSDDKVDFFSEARLMKDFSHENIVKLLGVCSIGDPGLVVMEFMLHGDLRSYLLSRRHLVNENSEEAMDVGPQGITKMAFDVANGLKYLTNLGFVHRDLACRNCLVHETGIVKIGDFGLTENVYNSGYVRCISNGKFPVRWMAPESLREGVFSSASDIWSFGVLMYEIFTFGALPYHGFTNEQVVVFVKNHKVIGLPAGCPENLEKLLKQCWSYESENRPTIDVIIDQLERMPLLLVPCLDVPRPQVGFDGSGGNNGLIVNFMDPSSKGSSSAKFQKSSGMAKHKTSLSGMSLLNNTKQLRFTNPEKSPDICSPQSTSAHCFDFPSLSGEGQFDLIKASEIPKKWREDSFDKGRDTNAHSHALRNSGEISNETKALLCNGCERSSTAPVLHRSISTEPRVTAIFKKVLDSKGNPDLTDASGWTCKIPVGQQSTVCHQQNKRHSRKKNSAASSSPAL